MKAATSDCSALSSGLEDDTGARESASAVMRFFPGTWTMLKLKRQPESEAKNARWEIVNVLGAKKWYQWFVIRFHNKCSSQEIMTEPLTCPRNG